MTGSVGTAVGVVSEMFRNGRGCRERVAPGSAGYLAGGFEIGVCEPHNMSSQV